MRGLQSTQRQVQGTTAAKKSFQPSRTSLLTRMSRSYLSLRMASLTTRPQCQGLGSVQLTQLDSAVCLTAARSDSSEV